ncbi:MAG: hypothetical protein GY711_34400 [bacterium]|nr:hypothetical protein [bacterium]
MTEQAEAVAHPPRRRKWRRRVLVVALVPALLFLTRNYLLHPLAARGIRWASPRFTDYRVEMDALHGNWVSHLRITGLRIVPVDESAPLRTARAKEVAIDYELLQRRLTSVRAHGVTADVVLPPTGGDDAAGNDASGWPRLPDSLPTIDARVDSFRLTRDDLLVEVQDVRADHTSGQIDLALDRVTVDDHTIRAVTARIGYDAGDLAIESLRVGERAALRSSRIDLSRLADERIAWEVELVALGSPLELEGTLEDGVLTSSFSGSALDLSNITEILPAAGLEGVLDLEGLASLALDDPLAGKLDVRLKGEAMLFAGRTFDRVQGELTLEDHALDVSRLVFETGSRRAELTLQALVSDEVARIDSGALVLRDGDLRVQGGELQLTGPVRDRRLLLDLEAHAVDLREVSAALGKDPWAGVIDGVVRLDGTLGRLGGEIDLSAGGVRIDRFDLGDVTVSAHGDQDVLVVDALSASGGSCAIVARGGWNFVKGELTETTFELDLTEADHYYGGFAEDGQLRASGTLSGAWPSLVGAVDVESRGLIVAGTPLREVAASARAEGGAIDVYDVRATTPFGEVTGALDVRLAEPQAPVRLELRELLLASDGKELRLESPSHVELGEPLVVRGLALAGSAGALTVELSAAHQTKTHLSVDAHITSRGLDPMPFLGSWIPEGFGLQDVDLDLGVVHANGHLSVHGSGRLGTLRNPVDDQPYALTFDGELQDDQLELRHLQLETGGTILSDLVVSAPLRIGGASLWADGDVSIGGTVAFPPERVIQLPIGESVVTLSGALDARLAVDGTWRALRGDVEIDARDLRLERKTGTLVDWMPEPADLVCKLVLDDGVELERFVLDLPRRARMEASGTAAVPLDVDAWTRVGGDVLDGQPVAVHGEIEFADLAWLAQFSESLRRLGGQGSADFAVGGTLDAPDIEARMHVERGFLKLTAAPQISDLEFDLSVRDDRLELEQLSGTLGAAPMQLAGHLDWGGAEPRLQLDVDGQNVLLQRTSTIRLRADVDAEINGPLSQLEARGKVRLRNSRMMQSVDLLGWLGGGHSIDSAESGITLPALGGGPLATMKLDLAVETAQPLRVLTNVARGGLGVSLTIQGTGEVPTPKGRVFLEPTRVSLPGGTLRLSGGYVEFTEKDPFHPTILVQGEARLAGYDVTMLVTGNYNDPVVELSSSPALPSDELLLLFLTGQPPTSGASDSTAAAQSLTVYIARDLVSKWASGGNLETEEDSFFDRFELMTGQDVSKSGVATLEARYRTLDTWLKHQDDDVYIVAERDVFENYNLGLRFVFRFR